MQQQQLFTTDRNCQEAVQRAERAVLLPSGDISRSCREFGPSECGHPAGVSAADSSRKV